MPLNHDELLLATKLRTLHALQDMQAIYELQIAELGPAYAPPAILLGQQRTEQAIANLQSEIAALKAQGTSDNPAANERKSYTDALLDVHLAIAHSNANQKTVMAKLESLSQEVGQHTRRLERIEGFLRASDAVRFNNC